ncbi:glycosyltransferase family 8 protein [Ruegeria atlantica]|uniref:glycosyltransferase family 8 protein n=1 Tax=Ruegeria atlantica TaxID=81569 RepID=UPI00249452F7|nr:glycosyltransferase family 8 protein [Ruegeria atlantica]
MSKRNSQVVLDRIIDQRSSADPRSANKTIEVCLAFDSNFVQHAAVTLLSAAQALSPEEKLIVHVLQAGDISSGDRDAFSKVAPESTIHWHEIDVQRFNKLPDNRDHVSLATYLRLFIPEVLGEISDRVIYLDCDTIVSDRLAKLWNQDIGDGPIAASPDEGGLTQAKRLGFDSDAFYFNAGVLVFNLAKLDPVEFWQSVEAVVSDDSINLELQDQDILNFVFKKKTHRLHLRWNANTRLYTPDEIEPAYNEDEAREAAFAPGILHFTDKRKPWNDNCNHPLRQLYWDLRNQTPWKESNSERARRQLKDFLRNRFSKSRKAVNRVW